MFWSKAPQKTEKAENPASPLIARHGTYCRTATFEQQPLHRDDGSYAADYVWKEYHEAYQQNGTHLWTINKIKIENENGKTVYKCRPQSENLPLLETLEELRRFESFQQSQYPGQNAAAEIADLGFRHFKAFAEREGLLWDKDAAPKALPHPEALPPGTYLAEEVEAARRRAHDTTAQPVAAGDTLAQIFMAAASSQNIELALDNMTKTGLADQFREMVSGFQSALKEMIKETVPTNAMLYFNDETPPRLCERLAKTLWTKKEKKYSFTGSEWEKRHYTSAYGRVLHRIDEANTCLVKMENTGLDTTPLAALLYASEMATHFICAQQLFSYCRKFPSHTENHTNEIQSALADAELVYKNHLGQESRELYESMKAGVSNGDEPKVPAFIQEFLNNYDQKRQRHYAAPRPRM